MTAWMIAGLALVTAGVLAGLLMRSRSQIRFAELQKTRLAKDQAAQLDQAAVLRDSLLKAVDETLLVLDTEQKILYANATAESWLGQDLAGKTLIAAIRQPELETLIDDARKLRGEAVERHIEYEHHILHGRAVASSDTDNSFEVLTLRDVTELQRLERSRRDMVSNISHELSTPITAIGLLADTLLNVAEKEKPRRLRKMAKDIRREADTLTQLVQEMRDLSLIESGQMPIRLTPNNLLSIVQTSVEPLLTLVEGKNQTISVAVPEDIFVLADDVQIQRAIKNILHNAVKFTPEGGHIQISATQNGNEVVLAVTDSGPGIPADDLPRVFERFFQVDRSRREGTGLGLAIVRHIVMAHGGRVWAESIEGEGATFYIALALAESETKEAEESEAEPES
jgi:two-component system phosphate regulon sensor histidine kinase PhoR